MTIEESQRYLSWLGLYLGKIDGLHGKKTQAAFDEFMEHEGWEGNIEAKLLAKMERFVLPDSNNEFELADAVRVVCNQMYATKICYPAYIMATCEHETAGQFVPLMEGDQLSLGARERYRETLDYKPFWGHGYVQLTHEYNFDKYGVLFGFDLAANPELALRKDLALFVLVHGMITGTFTGRSMKQYVMGDAVDLINMRRVVNGVRKGEKLPDSAEKIAGLYKKWALYYEKHS